MLKTMIFIKYFFGRFCVILQNFRPGWQQWYGASSLPSDTHADTKGASAISPMQ
jgi:hypothetical protein